MENSLIRVHHNVDRCEGPKDEHGRNLLGIRVQRHLETLDLVKGRKQTHAHAYINL